MSAEKRVYDVLLEVTMSKTVQVLANSQAEARNIVLHNEDGQLGALAFTEHVGEERVVDVVSAGDPWHFDRQKGTKR